MILKCPKCGNKMKYMPKDDKNMSKKVKRCVYCGKTFNVLDHVIG